MLPDASLKWTRPANGFLYRLLKSIDRDIGTPDNPKLAGVFLADAVPLIGMCDANKRVRKQAYTYCMEHYMLPLLDIIQPQQRERLERHKYGDDRCLSHPQGSH